MMTRSCVTAVLIVLLAAIPAGAALPSFNATQIYTQAEFEAAIRPYVAAIAQNPNDADAHYWLGVAYLHGFRLFRFGVAPYGSEFASRAIAELERALQLRPGMFGALLALLDLYALTGDQAKWAATFDRLIALNPPLPVR
jgi:tetratricopeptide (TPR) repeat protein